MNRRSNNGGITVNKIVVTVIDRQAIFRVGVWHVLSQEPGFEVACYPPDDQTLALLQARPPDVLLLDADIPQFVGLRLAKSVSIHCPLTRVIMLTNNVDDNQLFEIAKTGAADCLDRGATAAELARAVRQAYAGELPLKESILARPRVAERVLKQFNELDARVSDHISAPLTRTEREILQYIADGNSNKRIALILNNHEQTIKNHVSNILRKLHANDRAHAVVLAMRYGWISTQRLPDQSDRLPVQTTGDSWRPSPENTTTEKSDTAEFSTRPVTPDPVSAGRP